MLVHIIGSPLSMLILSLYCSATCRVARPSRSIYVARLPTLIQVILLKGSWLTYVAKKLMNLVVLVKQGIRVNSAIMVFNNLYNKLRDLFASTKPGMNKIRLNSTLLK
jgi:hypothetical protein